MLPTNDVVGSHLLVVLKSYFDGGNQGDSRRYDVMSLAVASGTIKQWRAFEKDWKKNLEKHGVASLHTTDAVARQDAYKGWDETKSDKFLGDCVKIAAKHHARQKHGDVQGRFGIFCYAIGVVLKDFVAAAKTNALLAKNVNESCMRQALLEVAEWSENQAACDECHFIFDQGEPFFGHLQQICQSKQANRDAAFLQKITSRSEADSRATPALQLADLFAWGISHRLQSNKKKWHKKLLGIHLVWQWIDESNVHDIDSEQQEAFRKWNLPIRTATK